MIIDNERTLGLAATTYGFTPDDLAEAAQIMSTVHPVVVRPLGRGGSEWDVEILLQAGYAVLVSLGPNIAASAIWDGLKLLLIKFRQKHGPQRPDPLVTFKVTETSEGDRSVEAFVRTDDPECLSRAMIGLTNVVKATFAESSEERNFVVYEEPDGWGRPE